ncbi:MAG: 50S ribosomal protein L9 [Candidatus Excrementavichristensenella sp.]|jgi:large subunit ribosomal protein L9|nr:50S ribosomal protein L9 [Bacillota bacterium]NLL53680.1 50S ribosomal protein L9 [Clostridiales bacterium]
MKVILLQDIRGTGKKDQIIEVSDGYARNYLLPRKMAREATKEALHSIEKAKAAEKYREEVKRAEAEQMARELKGKVVIVNARGGEGGKLYGSVTGQEIANAMKEQLGLSVDKRKIELDEPVRSAGQTLFTVRLAAGISARLILNVVVTTK